VLAGYNTATHSPADGNDPWALDLHRLDGPSADTPVLAPVSGTVSFVSTSCATIRDSAGTRILMCHIIVPQSLRNTTVARGQQIGTVAPAGQAGNNGTSHIHLALSDSTGRPLPFTGNYALEGTALPETGVPGAYGDVTFRSTITPGATANAGPDQTVRPRATVTLQGTATNPLGTPLQYQWTQVSGPAVTISPNTSALAAFNAPATSATLQFRFSVTDAAGDTVADTVTVRVSGNTPISATVNPTRPSGGSGGPGEMISGSIPASGGFGLVVFGGGTSDQLLAASSCPRATAAFWASSNGNFVTYVPGTTVSAVNQQWFAMFGSGIPGGTPLIGRCR
jgi:hypothetical protein